MSGESPNGREHTTSKFRVAFPKSNELTVSRSGVVMTAEAGSAGNAYVESSYKNVNLLQRRTVKFC